MYNTSDTALFTDMQLISQMYGPQIAIMPVGGKYTMDIHEAARAASLIRPDLFIPCHYGDTLGQPADIEELRRGLAFLSPGVQLAPLEPGETIEYTTSSWRKLQPRSE